MFDKVVGDLLGTVCGRDALWWEADAGRPKPKNPGKVADWAFRGATHTVLFECKSLRPSLELLTYGSDESVCEVRRRVVAALTQLAGHAATIRAGRWASHGLPPRPTVGVVVTYGRIQTVNGPFTRRRIAADLAAAGVDPVPHVVLSLEELDHAVRLAELGQPLDGVIAALAAADDSFDPLQRFEEVFRGRRAISTFAYEKGTAFMDGVGAAERPPRAA